MKHTMKSQTKKDNGHVLILNAWYFLSVILAIIVFISVYYLPYRAEKEEMPFHLSRPLYHSDVCLSNQKKYAKGQTDDDFFEVQNVTDNIVVSCYYNTPCLNNINDLKPENILPDLCTHINVAFATIIDNKISLQEDQCKTICNVVKLKEHNPDLKILLSIGGGSDDLGFRKMVLNHNSRKAFIKSVKSVLEFYALDGIDLDWEFPSFCTTQKKRERQHFSQLLRELRIEFIREQKNYLLTVAAAAAEIIVNIAYDIDQINLYVDFVNIMTYDYRYYSRTTPFTGFNSPLYPQFNESLYLAELNINYTVNMYLNKGLDRNKIVVGIPTYGHSYELVNEDNYNVDSPASGFGSIGCSGYTTYPSICNYLDLYNNEVDIEFDEFAKVPYLHKDKEWVSFENPQSVMEKAKYIKENGLRGAMIYALNTDDHRGTCAKIKHGHGKFPLVESVKATLYF